MNQLAIIFFVSLIASVFGIFCITNVDDEANTQRKNRTVECDPGCEFCGLLNIRGELTIGCGCGEDSIFHFIDVVYNDDGESVFDECQENIVDFEAADGNQTQTCCDKNTLKECYGFPEYPLSTVLGF